VAGEGGLGLNKGMSESSVLLSASGIFLVGKNEFAGGITGVQDDL
jgi:hypothetical protein